MGTRTPFLSLPGIFGTTLETVPANVPYLPADPSPHAFPKHALNVGLVWAGRRTHVDDANRSLELEAFRPLLELPRVRLVSLQVGERRAELRTTPGFGCIDDLGAGIEDFVESANLVAALDLVISVDTAAAHLAGALGKPVWTLLPFVSDWRWLRNRDDSPWYPSMRLFRQTQGRVWGDVFERVRNELQDLSRRV